MDYISIPDDSSTRSFKKQFKRLKSDIINNNGNIRKRLSIFAISLIFFWFFITPIFTHRHSNNNNKNKNKNLKNTAINEFGLISPSTVNYNMKTYFNPLIKKYNKLPINSSLRAQLAFNFPYDENSKISNNIFQTWKVPINDPLFPKHFTRLSKSWSLKNPNFTHNIITDNMIDEWIQQEFSNIPKIIKAWKLMPKFILKADFFRYLVIFARGGIYSDIDTSCLKSIDDWALFNPDYLLNDENSNNEKNLNQIGLAIGIEADPDRPDWAEWYARRIQFVQWTIVGKKGHPFLRELISRVVEETLRKEKLGTLNKIEGKDGGGDIMSWTGPGMFTDTFFDYLNNIQSDGKYGDGFGIGTKYWNEGKRYNLKAQELDNNGLPLHTNDMPINWLDFTHLKTPKIYDDIMILPITSFSPGVGQMGSLSPKHELAFVMHMFEGSWKP
ncbi:membrane-bound alpha-1,6- mannosyltransferase Initiation-specific [Pichia californica]|nr:membrane-bound alpha-1,6- mannosyltransferase Initiation-specific [[Candida] californica]